MAVTLMHLTGFYPDHVLCTKQFSRSINARSSARRSHFNNRTRVAAGFSVPPFPADFNGAPGASNSRAPAGGSTSRAATGASGTPTVDSRMQWIEKLILDLPHHDRRENSIVELARNKEVLRDLAPVLWFSFGTTAIFLQEIIMIYPFLSPLTLTSAQSHRACKVISILQSVAYNPATRTKFIKV